MSTPESEVQKIREVIERVKDSFTRIAGVAHLGEEAVHDDDYDEDLFPWNKGWMLRGAFSQIFKEAGAGWNLLFDDFDSIFKSLCAHGNATTPQPQAGQEGFKLDPVVRENLINDVEKLAGMSPELQLMASGICEDLGLPLPKAIKEKIAREKAARGAGGAA